MRHFPLLLSIVPLLLPLSIGAQEREDRTLLPQEVMTAIINEVSGERAMHTMLELVPYQRVRPPSEYSGSPQETQVMVRLAKEYGFSNITVEKFGNVTQSWQPTRGELWITTPKPIKLFDIHDVALSLASLNANGDFTGELIDVGPGRAQDFEGKDVAGKFVVSSGSIGQVYNQAIQRGAIGALALSTIGYQRASDYPNQIVSTTVNAQPNTVAWAITPEVQRNLSGMLLRGDKITIRSINQATQVSYQQEYVHAEIPGDGSTSQEVAISGHLYEGLIKQGANDDNSGCALTLEIGRAYIKLIREGKLPPPKRTINFQWVPEISGTNAWLNAHPEKAKRIIGTLNFDMEAIRIADSRSFWVLQRTPDTYPSYLNDIPQSMMEYVADISRERVRFRAGGYAPTQPVESQRGSKDAFYIKIDKHYGASDHVTYMQHGIPAVMLITWPDMWYHSSEDTPDKLDPTQFKRAAVVGLGSLAVLATGTDQMAATVLADNIGRGLSRMGESLTKGLGYLADAATPGLSKAYREALVAIRHQAAIEKAVLQSASVMWTDTSRGARQAAAFLPLIDQRANALLNEVKASYQLQAGQRGVPVAEPTPTAAEREAASLKVETVAGGRGGAPGGRGGAGGGRGGVGGGRGMAAPSLPQEYNAELSALLPKGLTVLQIRDFLSGEFTPLPLEDLMAVLRARESSGSVRLVPVTPGR